VSEEFECNRAQWGADADKRIITIVSAFLLAVFFPRLLQASYDPKNKRGCETP